MESNPRNQDSGDESFEQYHARLKKIQARVEMVEDGFFRESGPKKDEQEEPLY